MSCERRTIHGIWLVIGLLLGTAAGHAAEAAQRKKATPAPQAAPAPSPQPAPAPAPVPAPVAEAPPTMATFDARKIFDTRCAACHGTAGDGNGPAASALNPRPRNWKDAAWQKSVTDADITTVITRGGPALGRSALMPPNPDLEGRPAVVAELVKLVRAAGR